MANVFANLKIRSKIAAGFSVVLVILIGNAWFGYSGLTGTGAAADQYAQRVAVGHLARQLERDGLEMRQHMREFAQLNPGNVRSELGV